MINTVLKKSHLKSLENYREYYLKNGKRSEGGFGEISQLPDGVELKINEDCVMLIGNENSLKEMTKIIQAFSHDDETIGILYENALFLKFDDATDFLDRVTTVSMSPNAWLSWTKKMEDFLNQKANTKLTFNQTGYYQQPLKVDTGISFNYSN